MVTASGWLMSDTVLRVTVSTVVPPSLTVLCWEATESDAPSLSSTVSVAETLPACSPAEAQLHDDTQTPAVSV